MAGRKRASRDLAVWINGERVGTWTVTPNGGHAFAYADTWLASTGARPLSLTMPLAQGAAPFKGEVVSAWFENLLPDSANIRRRLEARYRARAGNAFDLLAAIGRDCVGAVQLLAMDVAPADVRHIEAEPLDEAGVARLIDQSLVAAAPGNLPVEDDLRISIAGAQEKTAMLWHNGQWCRPIGATPTTHILKLPIGLVGHRQADFNTSVENEWLCNRLLAAFGLPVPHCNIAHFGKHKVLLVTRFDRRLIQDGNSWWARLPQEDCCQALGIPPERKYETDGGLGMQQILDLLKGSRNAVLDRERFLTAQLLFWMLAAPDGHAKNFSVFLMEGGAFEMTPVYDVMSAWPVVGNGPNQLDIEKLNLAMRVQGANSHYRIEEILRRHWNGTAKRFGMGESFEPVIGRIIAATEPAIEQVGQALPAQFPDQVAESIFTGVRRQAARLAAMPAS